MCAGGRVFVHQRGDPVQQAVRDLALREQRELVAGPVRAEDHDPVGVGAEARAGLADVVCDEQVGALAAQLLGRPLERAGLRGEPDDDRPRVEVAGAGTDLGEDVLGRLELGASCPRRG